jgi:nucleotide-binding universal stress UspA family protein
VDKVVSRFTNPVEATKRYLEGHPTDLIVLATHTHNERMSWLSHSKAEPIARESHTSTLFIPQGSDGFVRMEDGSVNLKNVLIPVAYEPRPGAAIRSTVRLIESLGAGLGTIHLLHVGPAETMPAIDLPECENWTWNRLERSGPVVDTILSTSSEIGADLIAMSTAGHHGFLDALRGSTTERVLRHLKTPLLAVPPFQ